MKRVIALSISLLLVVTSILPSYVGIDTGRGGILITPSRLLLLFILLMSLSYLFLSSYALAPVKSSGNSLLLFVMASLAAVVASTNVPDSLVTLLSERWLIGIALVLVSFDIAGKDVYRKYIEGALAISAVIVVLVGFVDYLLGYSVYSLLQLPGRREIVEGFFEVKERSGLLRMQSSLNNPVTLSTFLIIVVPLIVLKIRQATSFLLQLFMVGVCAILIAGVLLTLVRSAIAALIVQLFMLRRLIPRNIKYVLYLFLPLLLIGVLVVKNQEVHELYENMVLQHERTVKNSTLYRISLLESGIDKFSEFPLFGVGQNRFSNEVTGEYLDTVITFEHHENLFLTMLVEVGLLGFLAFSWLVLNVWRILRDMAKHATSKEDYYTARAYQAIFVGWAICSLFLDSLSFTQISIPFWLLVGIALRLGDMRFRSP